MTVAKTRDVIFVATEIFLFCGSEEVRFVLRRKKVKNVLEFEGAELLVYYLPDDLV